MPLIFPVLFWTELVCIYRRQKIFDLRTAILAASVVAGIALFLITETLSLFNLVNRTMLTLFWAAPAVLLLYRFHLGPPAMKDGATATRPTLLPFVAVVPLLAGTVVVAIVAAPNNYDSMTYHLPRVMHWVQNSNVAYFPSSIARQLELTPWAEYALLHCYLLADGDRLVNLIQWFGFLGCVVGASVLARQLDLGSGGQALAALVVATTPMAVLQATSTQNDLVAAFWLVCFVVFGLSAQREEGRARWWLLMGASLGLAVLTKATTYVYAAPFGLWFLLTDLRQRGKREMMLKYLVILTVLVALNSCHAYRNYVAFGNPLSSSSSEYRNGRMTPTVLVSNALRNASLHLRTPWESVNRRTEGAIRALHRLASVDPDDRATTFGDTQFSIPRFVIHEDFTGNPFHFILIAVAIVVATSGNRLVVPYKVALALTFALFCLLFKWQPWHSRLQLPIFILASPIIGALLVRGARRWLVVVVGAALLGGALTTLAYNASRPITLKPLTVSTWLSPTITASVFRTPRTEQYFNSRSPVRESYVQVVQALAITGYKNIGIKLDGDDYEYPLWALARINKLSGLRIEHVGVTNYSRTLSKADFQPEVVIASDTRGRVFIEK